MEEQAIQILLVEDDPEVAQFLRTHLARTRPDQFEITHTGQLEEALTLVQEQTFDVVLSDPGRTGTRGLDAVLRFHESAEDLPILVLVDPLDKTLEALWTMLSEERLTPRSPQ